MQGGIVQVILRSFDFTLLDELLLLNYSTIDLQCVPISAVEQ